MRRENRGEDRSLGTCRNGMVRHGDGLWGNDWRSCTKKLSQTAGEKGVCHPNVTCAIDCDSCRLVEAGASVAGRTGDHLASAPVQFGESRAVRGCACGSRRPREIADWGATVI